MHNPESFFNKVALKCPYSPRITVRSLSLRSPVMLTVGDSTYEAFVPVEATEEVPD